MKDIWSETTAESALLYLRDTDDEFGILRGRLSSLDKNEKVILASEFLDAEGTVAEREAKSRTSTAYREWQGIHEDVAHDLHILTAKRNTKASYLECWRSVYSARKRGNI